MKVTIESNRRLPRRGLIVGMWLLFISLRTVSAAVPVMTSATNATGTVGLPFNYLIYGQNSPTNFAASPLPAGLGVDPLTGMISGTPTTAGTNSITLSASNGSGTGSTVLQLVVAPSGSIQFETYPGPGGSAYQSGNYTVEISDGLNWSSSYTYKYSRSSATAWHWGTSPAVHFTTFGTTGPVNCRITKVGGSITNLSVSPISKNIPTAIVGSQAFLTITQNDKIWVTVNGDDSNPLFIFADALKPAVPNGATYFGVGVTNIAPASANHYQARSDEVIYLDGGAWVKGTINVQGTSNVRIMGPGVLSGELWNSETVQTNAFNDALAYCMVSGDCTVNGNGCQVQGVTLVASPFYNLRYIQSATGVKLLSPWYGQTDGMYAQHADQCFAFAGDNVFFTLWYAGGSEEVTIANSFAANDNNAIVNGGYWGFASNSAWYPVMVNCDMRLYSPSWTNDCVFQAWVDNTDSTYGYRNHVYQDIRVEGNVTYGNLIQWNNKVYPWGGSNPNPPLGTSSNFIFDRVTLQGTQAIRSVITG